MENKTLRNRKKISYLQETYNIKDIIEHQIFLFNMYITKRYYYCGGNNGEHLIYFRRLYPTKKPPKYPVGEEEYCYICRRSLYSKVFIKKELDLFMWEPSEVFYIYDSSYKDKLKDSYMSKSRNDTSNELNDKIYIIGRCCLNRYRFRFITKAKDVPDYFRNFYKLKRE